MDFEQKPTFIPCMSVSQLPVLYLPICWQGASGACTHSVPNSAQALLLLSSTSSPGHIVCPWQTASALSSSWKCLLINVQVRLWEKYGDELYSYNPQDPETYRKIGIAMGMF